MGEDLVFVVLDVEGHRVDFRPEEAGRERMGTTGFLVGVTHLELFVAEFAVNEEDLAGEGDFFCHLDGEDALAQVGVGEEAADLSFVP